MSTILVIRVETSTGCSENPFKKVFERQIPYDDNLVVPFSNLLSSLRFIFGDACMITFIVY